MSVLSLLKHWAFNFVNIKKKKKKLKTSHRPISAPGNVGFGNYIFLAVFSGTSLPILDMLCCFEGEVIEDRSAVEFLHFFFFCS